MQVTRKQTWWGSQVNGPAVGAKVVVADISTEGGKETMAPIKANGGEALFCATDVTNEDQVKNLVRHDSAHGRLDCACNNAGFGNRIALTAELEVKDWEPVLNL